MDTLLKNKLWEHKYRPRTLKDYIFHDSTQELIIREMVASNHIPHILMSGVQGSGKTSLAFILIKELNIDESDLLVINASDENSVDVVRDKIRDFVSPAPTGPYRVVLLEEADYISLSGQAALRGVLDNCGDTARFIITCNYVHKIIPAIQSRFTAKFTFSAPSKAYVTEYLAKILITEKVKFTLDRLDQYVESGYPDVRTILGSLQQYSVNGELIPYDGSTTAGDYKLQLLELLEADRWNDIRVLLSTTVAKEEYEDVYRFLYDNIHHSPKFQNEELWEEAIKIISEYLYKHSIVADSEINAAAMFISLKQLK